jgi:hypothetical protein
VRYVFALLGALIVGVLGWGYWHVSVYGDANVSLNDVGLKTDRQLWGRPLAADLVFKDASEAMLARAKAEPSLGIVWIQHPIVGDCRQHEKQASTGEGMAAWRQCIDTKMRWVPTWIRQVRHVRVALDGCTIEQAPVSLEAYRDAWWLWWVPLPHIGGAPYTYFSLAVWFDSRACRAVAPVR